MGELTLARYTGVMADQVSRFTRFLRGHGYCVTAGETEAALVLMQAVDLTNPRHLMMYWRSVYSKTEEQWIRFPDMFNRFFYPEGPRLIQRERLEDDESPATGGDPANVGRTRYESREHALFAYSPRAGSEVSLSPDSDLDYAAMKWWTRRILRQWAQGGADKRPAGSGKTVHWRKTIEQALRYGGEPGIWIRRQRDPDPARLAVLVDVSGSMRAYAPFYLGFVWQFLREGVRLECFLSSNRLLRVTPFLRQTHPGGRPVADPAVLGGGTRLGWAFSLLRQQYPAFFTSRTTFVVASDGYDTGELGLLAESFPDLASRVRQVIWLNPLMLNPGYEPRSQAMKVVLPYCSAHVGVYDPWSWIDYGKSLI